MRKPRMPEDPQSLPGRKTSTCKGPEVGMGWCVEGEAQAGVAGGQMRGREGGAQTAAAGPGECGEVWAVL